MARTNLTGKLKTTVENGLKAAQELQQNAQAEADSYQQIVDALCRSVLTATMFLMTAIRLTGRINSVMKQFTLVKKDATKPPTEPFWLNRRR